MKMNQSEVARARAETPGVEKVIHLNNCGAGLMPQAVLDAQIRHLQLEAGMGGYEAEDAAQPQIEHSYDAIARLLNCGRDEIAIMENATMAWVSAFYGMRFQPGDKVLTAVSEYASNFIAYLQLQERCGIEVVVVPDDEYGQLDVRALANLIDDRVKLISVTHVPTSGGLINPAREIGKVARDAGIPYLLDACQSAGQLPLDVAEIGCDMLSATSRKYLRGPRGMGFLYVREGFLDQLDPPYLDLHSAVWTGSRDYTLRADARRFENWENAIAGKIALGVAVDYALSFGMEAISDRIITLAAGLRDRLNAIPGVQTHDLGKHKGGIISFSVDKVHPDELVRRMRAEGINIHTSSIHATRTDLEARGIQLMNRLGLHYYNSEAELDRFASFVEDWA